MYICINRSSFSPYSEISHIKVELSNRSIVTAIEKGTAKMHLTVNYRITLCSFESVLYIQSMCYSLHLFQLQICLDILRRLELKACCDLRERKNTCYKVAVKI